MANERILPGLMIKGYADKFSDDWHLWADVNWRLISAIVRGYAKSRTTVLPGSGADDGDDVYIVKSDDGTNPNKIAVWDGATGAKAWVYLDPLEGMWFWIADENERVEYRSGAWNVFSGGGGNSYYDVRSGFSTTPTSSQILDTIVTGREITFPANFSGSVGRVQTNPTASFVISVKDDGTEIGTVTIATDGSFTFATDGGTQKVVAAGSILTFVGPASADATVANGDYTLLGTAS